MTVTPTRTALVGLLLAGLLAACGSTTSSSTTSSTSTSATMIPATSTTAIPTDGTTPAVPAGPQNVVVTPADKATLTAAYVAHMGFPPADIGGTRPGSVYAAYVPSTGVSWAFAELDPSAAPSYQTQVSMQDGGSMGIFTKPPGGSWTMVANGFVPFCPSKTVIPADVQSLWGLSDSAACAQG